MNLEPSPFTDVVLHAIGGLAAASFLSAISPGPLLAVGKCLDR